MDARTHARTHTHTPVSGSKATLQGLVEDKGSNCQPNQSTPAPRPAAMAIIVRVAVSMVTVVVVMVSMVMVVLPMLGEVQLIFQLNNNNTTKIFHDVLNSAHPT